jgi:hypothetical protein
VPPSCEVLVQSGGLAIDVLNHDPDDLFISNPLLASLPSGGRSGARVRRGGVSPPPLDIRDFTNGRGSDVDGPIRHAKPDRRTHTHEVPHTRAVPHRPDIHQPPLAAALQ